MRIVVFEDLEIFLTDRLDGPAEPQAVAGRHRDGRARRPLLVLLDRGRVGTGIWRVEEVGVDLCAVHRALVPVLLGELGFDRAR